MVIHLLEPKRKTGPFNLRGPSLVAAPAVAPIRISFDTLSVIKDDTETIDEISVDKTYLMAAMDDMHEFALAVESNITKSI